VTRGRHATRPGTRPGVRLTAAQAALVLAALGDAAAARRERAAAYCYECAGHPAGACDEHLDDLDAAEAYETLAAGLAKEDHRDERRA